MIIRVERTGGFAGMTMRSVINTEQLDPEDRQNLMELVESSGIFESSPESDPDQQGRDRFHYSLTIEYHEQHRTLELDESEIPDSWQSLIQCINNLARRYRT
jgi:hypothetical protein